MLGTSLMYLLVNTVKRKPKRMVRKGVNSPLTKRKNVAAELTDGR